MIITKDYLYDKYIVQNIRSIDIAKELKVSRSFIANKLKFFGISKVGKFKPKSGDMFGGWKILGEGPKKKYKYTWICQCHCGIIKNLCKTNLKRNSSGCPACSKKKGEDHYGYKGYKELSGRYWCIIQIGARSRNLEINISIEQAWDKFVEQNFKCALSGLPLVFSTNGKTQTASLDRIDSKEGYNINNIQWVHKDLNQMKMDFDQSIFIEYCHLVAQTHSRIN